MRIRLSCSLASLVAICGLTIVPADGQSAAAKDQTAALPHLPDGKPNFNGIWDRPRVADITKNGNECGSASKGCKQEGSGDVSMTAWGMEQFKAKEKFDYAGYCQP